MRVAHSPWNFHFQFNMYTRASQNLIHTQIHSASKGPLSRAALALRDQSRVFSPSLPLFSLRCHLSLSVGARAADKALHLRHLIEGHACEARALLVAETVALVALHEPLLLLVLLSARTAAGE